MADIRINSLPTTASASSSDDFLALDGATNGTRKLNAYSPTFGGNLTVSGTGTHTFGTTNTVTIAAGKISTTGKVGIGTTAHPSLQLTVVQPTANAAALWTESVNTLGQSQGVIINAGTNASDFGLVVRNASQTDMFKVDGASNATLAGNLTVSGTGGISIGSATFTGGRALTATTGSGNSVGLRLLQTSVADWEIKNVATTGALSFQQSAGELMSLSSTGQIALAASSSTPSVLITQTDPAAYSLVRLRNTGGTAQSYDVAVGGSGTGSLAQKFYVYDNTAGAIRVAIAPTTGNFLLGTTTDSGNGKLQLADHTASTGGIGFGSDVALFRAGGNTLRLNLGVSAAALWFDNGGLGTGGARILGSSGALTVTSNGANSLYLQTGGTTALTLDSSQNATFAGQIKGNSTQEAQFAGAVRIKNALVADAASAGFLDFVSGATRVVSYGANNSTAGTFSLVLRSANSSINSTALSFDTSSNATFAGSIAINNTVQTAVSVASTHKVTISIGGSTYYLLATNV